MLIADGVEGEHTEAVLTDVGIGKRNSFLITVRIEYVCFISMRRCHASLLVQIVFGVCYVVLGIVCLTGTDGLDVFGWYAPPYLASGNLRIL